MEGAGLGGGEDVRYLVVVAEDVGLGGEGRGAVGWCCHRCSCSNICCLVDESVKVPGQDVDQL